jgi:hypothetical protein
MFAALQTMQTDERRHKVCLMRSICQLLATDLKSAGHSGGSIQAIRVRLAAGLQKE